MKNKIKSSFFTFLSILMVQGTFALKTYPSSPGDNNTGNDSGNHRESAQACQASAGATDLDLNNVRARINTGGDMWWDLQGTARYEIPKGSKKCSMFSGSLWMAGVDVNGQLKCAAQTYRAKGNDFWSGPLTTDGTASIDAATCVKYDKHFKITRAEVNQFVAYKLDANSMPGYTVPTIIKDWPAHGDVSLGQDYYLAPFFDKDGDGTYNTDNGDYPLYDLKGTIDCHKSDGDRILFGDMTLWWVFNDKGNIHSETGGSPIGMEIRAQAFAFATNDEINNMTFYNYQMINRSTYTLTNTYFSQWADTDLGDAKDDFVGCDVQRGLGYCYNGNEVDGTGKPTEYGANPPAIGIDFFQGPYMDKDGMDNPKNIDEGINGVNFGDGVVDNERFGMKRFVFHNNGGTWATSDPDKAVEYYQLLQGIWKDGTVMMYGGNGYGTSACGPRAKFMFPGNSDPLHWGTDYQIPNCNVNDWTEETVGNTPADRRFMHSAGPFTLKPGSVNFITVGVPWARAASGGPSASVQLLKAADDKCQRLFDNCFKVVNGPDAPDMAVQEMDKEIILTLSNPTFSNNYAELYPFRTDGTVAEFDFSIITPLGQTVRYDSLFRFQGYQIFQLKDNTVTLAEAFNARNGGYDPDKVRVVAQCDIKDNVNRMINYSFDESLGANIPVEVVNGENKGIRHSFRILNDEFATGDKRLVNHKKYFYIAIAYANNEYKKYNPMDGASLDGQKMPYKAGRKSPVGAIRMLTAIPHDPTPDVNGTAFMAPYGYGPKITRIEGQGNGGMILDMTPESINEVMAANSIPYIVYHPEYLNARGPINVKVIDPLNVPDANFTLKFTKGTLVSKDSLIFGATWTLTNETTGKIYTSEKAICVPYVKPPLSKIAIDYIAQPYEQIIPEIGLSVTITQTYNPGDFHADSLLLSDNFGLLETSLSYADSSSQWLGAVPDVDGMGDYDWICSGAVDGQDYFTGSPSHPIDEKQVFEKMVGGTIAPYRMTSSYTTNPSSPAAPSNIAIITKNQLSDIASVDIVFTPDKDKWTRCPVVELCPDAVLSEGGVKKFSLRKGASKDKDGNTGTPEATDNGDHPYGMSWFPGYAINIETGERLNLMFGEDSWLIGERGRDMWFNPTSNYTTDLGKTLFGGKHYLYVFGHNKDSMNLGKPVYMPAYDKGAYVWSKLNLPSNNVNYRNVYWDAMYVSMPMALRGKEAEWLSNEAKIRIRVSKPYKKNYSTFGASSPQNLNMPMYTFNTTDIATKKNDPAIAKAALYKINIVPNPYYAYSSYERSQLDNTVKITNLPNKCAITIFTLSGTLVRKFDVDKAGITLPRIPGSIEPKTSIDWDLKNEAGIPIASGIYLIHVNVEGVGERTIKWFGSLRPVDLDSF